MMPDDPAVWCGGPSICLICQEDERIRQMEEQPEPEGTDANGSPTSEWPSDFGNGGW